MVTIISGHNAHHASVCKEAVNVRRKEPSYVDVVSHMRNERNGKIHTWHLWWEWYIDEIILLSERI